MQLKLVIAALTQLFDIILNDLKLLFSKTLQLLNLLF